MASKNKRRGNTYEYEIVKEFTERGYKAERSWGSDGRSLGLHAEVDVRAFVDNKPLHIQCKRRKKLPEYIYPNNVHAVFVREDRKESLVVLTMENFLRLLKGDDLT